MMALAEVGHLALVLMCNTERLGWTFPLVLNLDLSLELNLNLK